MAKTKQLTQDDQDIDVAFASLLDRFVRDTRLVRRVASTFYAFKVGDSYTFRLAPGSRPPYYVDGVILVDGFTIDREGKTVTLGELELVKIDGVILGSLRDASNAFGPIAVSIYRSLQLARAQAAMVEEMAKAAASPQPEVAKPAGGQADDK